MMIELIDNAIQILTLIVCVSVSVLRAARFGSRSWTMLAFFYGTLLMGDIYWAVYQIFLERSPQVSVAADLSWYAAYILLYLLMRHILPPEEVSGKRPLALLGPALSIGMGIVFMMRGEIINNAVYAGLMGLLMYSAIIRLSDASLGKKEYILPAAVLAFCIAEYALWISSLFWNDKALFHPYYIFDLIFTASFPLILNAVKKAVEP
ncbi:MAG: hypothetical protein K5911_05090 [Eubacteriales bacterium]|nr:hypothetical protein [Eubacteriales bacterium]